MKTLSRNLPILLATAIGFASLAQSSQAQPLPPRPVQVGNPIGANLPHISIAVAIPAQTTLGSPIANALWSPGFNEIALNGQNNGVYNFTNNSVTLALPGAPLGWNGSGDRLVLQSASGLQIYNVSSRATVRSLSTTGMVPSSVAVWSRNDARVATVDGTITRVWDAASGAQLFKLGFRSSQNANDPNQQINTDAVGSPEWSNDGTKLLVVRMAGSNSNVSGMAQIHDAANGNRLVQIFPTNAPDPLANIAHWSPDNTKVLLAGTNLEIHNATSGALIRKIDLNNDINSAEWSPNGTQIVTVTHDAKFQVWDAATGNLVRTLEQPSVSTSQDYKAAFSPNGSKIMTVLGNRVKIWDAANGTLLQTFEHGSPVRLARWRPSSNGVLTIEITGGKARAWKVG